VTLSFWAKTTQGDTTLYTNLYYGDAVDTYNSVTQVGSAVAVSTTSSWRKYSVTFNALPTLVNRGIQVYIYSADAATSPIYFITGIQLEKGSQATPFEFRQYGTELQLCQRYYQLNDSYTGVASGTTMGYGFCSFQVPMRIAPSLSAVGVLRITDGYSADYAQSSASAVINSGRVSPYGVSFDCANFTGLTSTRPFFSKQASSNNLAMSAEL
jgi:hypothetical protein